MALRFVLPEVGLAALRDHLATGVLAVQTPQGGLVGTVHSLGPAGRWQPLPAVRWVQVARVPPKWVPADLQSALSAVGGIEALEVLEQHARECALLRTRAMLVRLRLAG